MSGSLLTDVVDVLLQGGLLLLSIDAGQVQPVVAAKLCGFKPVCLMNVDNYFLIKMWSQVGPLFHLLAASMIGDLLTLKKRPM